jgi:hypothetical protein
MHLEKSLKNGNALSIAQVCALQQKLLRCVESIGKSPFFCKKRLRLWRVAVTLCPV